MSENPKEKAAMESTAKPEKRLSRGARIHRRRMLAEQRRSGKEKSA